MLARECLEGRDGQVLRGGQHQQGLRGPDMWVVASMLLLLSLSQVVMGFSGCYMVVTQQGTREQVPTMLTGKAVPVLSDCRVSRCSKKGRRARSWSIATALTGCPSLVVSSSLIFPTWEQLLYYPEGLLYNGGLSFSWTLINLVPRHLLSLQVWTFQTFTLFIWKVKHMKSLVLGCALIWLLCSFFISMEDFLNFSLRSMQ